MSAEVTVPLTPEVAKAIIFAVAKDHTNRDDGYDWWARNAEEGVEFYFGSVAVRLAQCVYPTADMSESMYGVVTTELVFLINDTYFALNGEYSSYSSDDWGALKEVRPTKVTRQVFEAVK